MTAGNDYEPKMMSILISQYNILTMKMEEDKLNSPH